MEQHARGGVQELPVQFADGKTVHSRHGRLPRHHLRHCISPRHEVGLEGQAQGRAHCPQPACTRGIRLSIGWHYPCLRVLWYTVSTLLQACMVRGLESLA